MKVIQGDCLDVLRSHEGEPFEMAYVDPPFFTQRKHVLSPRSRDREFSFSDIWRSHSEYAEFLLARLAEVRRVLSSRGAVFFHCDRSGSHIARAVLDELFGASNFRSEIIWTYRRWSNSKKGLLPSHQNILYYSKSSDFIFNQTLGEYSPSTNVDQILQRRGRDESGKSVYARDENGATLTNGAKKGVPLGDVWDIPYLNPKAKERVGYPTQKPIVLLERIIEISTNAGDRVLDPFCGSGTTLVAAGLLGRECVGIDASPDAIELAERRLESSVKTESALLSKGRESYRVANQEALAALAGLDLVPVHRNKGIDAILRQEHEGRPVVLRVQRPGESVNAAALALFKAARSKDAGRQLLIVTDRSSPMDSPGSIPACVELIHSPAVQVRRLLNSGSRAK